MLAAADVAREDVLPKANQPPIVKLGRKLLSESGWAALPDDKGGGYTLVASSDMLPLVEKVLSSGMYVKLERHFTLDEKLLKVARALASRIQTLEEEDGLAAAINKSLDRKGACAVLRPTCRGRGTMHLTLLLENPT